MSEHQNPSEFIRTHTGSIITSIITSLGLILGAAVTIDNRYAHAESVRKTDESTLYSIRQQTTEIRRQGLILRRSLIEDRMFEMDVRRDMAEQSLPPLEEAQYKRYTRQLQEIDASITSVASAEQTNK